MNQEMMGKGIHLMLDLYRADDDKLKDEKLIQKLLDGLPAKIGMEKMCEPKVIKMEPKGWDQGGVSGFVMISTSHIAMHSFAGYGYLTADVYSCEEFDTEKVTRLFAEAFNAKIIEKQVISRGRNFAEEVLPKIKQTIKR